MYIARVTVKPQKNGTFSIRLQGIDDAGHQLDSWVSSPNQVSVGSVLQAAIKSLSTVASQVTEEEVYEGKKAK